MHTQPSTMEYVDTEGTAVRVIRSAKRKKTISAAWKQDTMVVSVPAGLSLDAERMLVDDMVKKIRRKLAAGTAEDPDAQLLARAHSMDAALFGKLARPVSVRWVANQNRRWGSASLRSRRIRLSHRLRSMPQWVQDYVLAHELAHLVEPLDGHGPRFKAALERYPRAHDAKIFLSGVSHGMAAARAGDMGLAPGIPGAAGIDPDDGIGGDGFDDDDFDNENESDNDHNNDNDHNCNEYGEATVGPPSGSAEPHQSNDAGQGRLFG
ncbi:SprT-like domain-containing protein [Paeniglutamicibacter gangotriensis]|uniref:M48 family metallopeptidase n=1 Tax=Paeniglutamicibacter gangotriensis TaxID=254787 RepID=UPI0037CAD4A8